MVGQGPLSRILADALNDRLDNNSEVFHVARTLRLDVRELMVFINSYLHMYDEYGSHLSPLHIVASRDKIDILTILISEGWNLNEDLLKVGTPLYIALDKGCLTVARKLIDFGADFKSFTFYGETPMAAALNYNKKNKTILSAVKLLIEAGVSLDAPINKSHQEKPLHLAIINNKLNVVSFLLQSGANPNVTDIDGNTPLHVAVFNDNYEAIKLLLQYEVDFLKVNRCHYTPLSYAALGGKIETIKTFLDCGFDINENIHPADESTLLQFAVLKLNTKLVKYLVDSKADLNKTQTNDNSPLQILARGQLLCVETSNEARNEIIEILLENGTNIDCGDNTENSPLYLALQSKFFKFAKALVKEGARINRKLNSNSYIFHEVVSYNKDIINTFLEFGGDYCVQTMNSKMTPYHHAILNRVDVKYIKQFVISGCPYNQEPAIWENVMKKSCNWGTEQFFDAQRSFFCGLNQNNLSLMKSSVKRGAIPTGCSFEIPFPLHLVVLRGSKELTEYLLDCNFPPNHLNDDRETALYVAGKEGHLDICKLLLKHGACYKPIKKNKPNIADDFKNTNVVDLLQSIENLFALTRLKPGLVLKELKAKINGRYDEYLVYKNAKNPQGQTLSESLLQNGHAHHAFKILTLELNVASHQM